MDEVASVVAISAPVRGDCSAGDCESLVCQGVSLVTSVARRARSQAIPSGSVASYEGAHVSCEPFSASVPSHELSDTHQGGSVRDDAVCGQSSTSRSEVGCTVMTVSQSVLQSVGRSVSQSVGQSVCQPVCQSVSRSVGQSGMSPYQSGPSPCASCPFMSQSGSSLCLSCHVPPPPARPAPGPSVFPPVMSSPPAHLAPGWFSAVPSAPAPSSPAPSGPGLFSPALRLSSFPLFRLSLPRQAPRASCLPAVWALRFVCRLSSSVVITIVLVVLVVMRLFPGRPQSHRRVPLSCVVGRLPVSRLSQAARLQ